MLGQIIALEGLDGAGKSTQAIRLAESLKEEGYTIGLSKEPNDTPTAKYLRDYLKDHAGENPVAETGLFIAAQAENWKERVVPLLEQRDVVITDRFFASTIAYQCARYGIPESVVRDLQRHITGYPCPVPVNYILLDLSAGTSMLRSGLRERGSNDPYDLSKLEERRKTRYNYTRQAKSNAWTTINAEARLEVVAIKVKEAALAILNK